MQAAQVAIMQKIIKLLTPTSPAYNNTLAFEQPTTPKELERMLMPGDVIFSRTNSHLYQAARNYMGINYDHVAVVLNPRQVIHISPPVISRLDMAYIVDPRREPMIIRPKVENMEKFMLVINNYLGEKYNISAIGQIGLRQMKAKLKKQEKNKFSILNLKHSRICSDSVLYALLRASPSIEKSLETQLQKTKFQQLGFFLPDEIANILLANDSELLLKSKLNSEYKFVDYCSQGGEKVVRATQKIVEVSSVCNKKIKSHLKNYRIPTTFNSGSVSQTSKLTGLQIFSLILGLGHTLGVLTLTNTSRFIMLTLNLIIIMGHYQEMKHYFRSNLPHL